jgi:hypothetical protein
MSAKSKLGGKEVYYCVNDGCWKYDENNKKVEIVYAVEIHNVGEGITFTHGISDDDLRKIEEIVGCDFVDDIGPDIPFKIKLATKEEMRQATINGCLYDGHSQANAERIADGLSPLEELDDE